MYRLAKLALFTAVTSSACLSCRSCRSCLKLELTKRRFCILSWPCQPPRIVSAHCSPVERRTYACRCWATTRLPLAAGFAQMPHAVDLATALTGFLDHEDSPLQQQQGSLSATCIPPSPVTAALGSRVEHLSATQDGTLVGTIRQQLQLPEVSCHQYILKGAADIVCQREDSGGTSLACINHNVFAVVCASSSLLWSSVLVSCSSSSLCS